MGDLAADTAVEHLAPGRFRATLHPDWNLVGPNGGYLAAVAIRAAAAMTQLGGPASMSCQFLAPARFGQVELAVAVLRNATRAQALRVSMTQHDEHVLEALVWAAPHDATGPDRAWLSMPRAPDPDLLRDLRSLLVQRRAWVPPWHNCVTLRVVPTRSTPQLTWARFRPVATFDSLWLEACRYLIVMDSLQWPAVRESLPRRDRILALTLHLSVDFHAFAPDSPWLLVDARGAAAGRGFVGGLAHVWSAHGRLVASGIQQMLLHELTRTASFARR